MNKILLNGVTIITVVRNEDKKIAKTIESVLNQTFNNYDYVIVDGGSADNTLPIISSYQEYFENSNISYNFISEKDNGIYDAMNKALSYITKDWVLFLNAGDLLYSNTILEEVFKHKITSDIGVIYGETKIKDHEDYYLRKTEDISKILIRMPFCHQSALTRSCIMREYGFDTRFSICADYNFFMSCYKNKAGFMRIPEIISIFSIDGVSENNVKIARKQIKTIRKENNTSPDFIVAVQFKLYDLKLILKSIIPRKGLDYYKKFKKIIRK